MGQTGGGGRGGGGGGAEQEYRELRFWNCVWRRSSFLLLLLFLLPVVRGQARSSVSYSPYSKSGGYHSVPGPGLSVYMSEEEVRRLIGMDAELYYVRNDIINYYALSFRLVVPSEMNSLHFSWYAKSKIEYKLGFQVDRPLAVSTPQANISGQGEVPRFLSGDSYLMKTNNKLESCSIGIYDSSECQKPSTFYSGERLISDFSLPEQELIKRCSGLSTLSMESNIYTHHEALILTKFEFLQKNCCNLFRKQNHSNIKGLRPIDLPAADHLKAITKHKFKAGQKLCPRCRQDLCVKLQDLSSPKFNSDSDDPTNASENLNASFSPLGISPLKIQRIRKQNSLSYAKRKLSETHNAIADQIAVVGDLTPADMKAEPESGQCKKCSDYDILLTELKQKLELSSNREKIQILTLAPHSWTSEKTALEFGVSTRMVKKARKLKQQGGILAVPTTKRRKVLAQQITQKVLDFYEDDEISRLCPGKKR